MVGAEIHVTEVVEQPPIKSWFISGEIWLTGAPRADTDADAELAAALLKAFRRAQALAPRDGVGC